MVTDNPRVGTPPATTQPPTDRRVLPRGAAFWLTALATTLLLISSTVPSPMYVIYQQRWHFSAAMITVVFGVYAVFVLASMLLFGSLSDTAGRRPVLLAALALMLAATLLFWAAQSVAWLLAARAVQGISVGIATGTLGATLIELSPPSAPMRGMLINTVAPTIGMATGALGSGILVQYAPHPTTLPYALLFMMFTAVTAATVFLPETSPRPGTSLRLTPRRISIPARARRPFAVVALSIIAVWALGGLYLSLGPSLVAEMLHSDNHMLGGLVVTALAGGGSAAQLMFGRLTGHQPIVLGGTLLLAALGAVTAALSAGSATWFFTATVVLGLGWGSAFMGAFRSIAALADPTHRSELLAAVYTVAYLAMCLPAIGAGIAARHIGLHTTTTAFTGTVAALIILALTGLPLVAHHHRTGHAGAHEPRTQHTPAPCSIATHDTTGTTATPALAR